MTPDEVRNFWWARFRDRVSWDPRHYDTIFKVFQQKCAKRLSDILGKKRKKGTQPKWMGDEAWIGLLEYWQSDAFLKISTQNKTNRASEKGGAVHTTGRRSHLEVALDMVQTSQGPVDPAEFFRATHQKSSGEWVDSRSKRTYEEYRERLIQIQTQVNDASTDGMQEVDGARKLQLWQDVVGGRTRGRCYGTADMSLNVRRGMSSLTQESHVSSSHGNGFETEEVVALREEATRAREEAAKAREEAALAREQTVNLEAQFHAMMERMAALERNSSRGRPHPDYDDDLDDHSLD